MRSEIAVIFNAKIADTFKDKREVLNFLMNHERKNLCLDNLCAQIAECERRALRIGFDAKTYEWTINDVAVMFCKQALRKAAEDSMTQAERVRKSMAVDDNDKLARDMIADGMIIDRDEARYKLGADNGPSEAPTKE